MTALRQLYPKRPLHTPLPLLEDLTQRGFIQNLTRRDALQNALQASKQTVYAGVDPTAGSLHIGHLIPLICLLHFQVRGHSIIPLVSTVFVLSRNQAHDEKIGGATGRVGDPSGRLTERQPADIKKVEDNVVNLTSSIQLFFKRALPYARSRIQLDEAVSVEPQVVSNLQWHETFTLLDFLAKVGLHARVNAMMNRESVRARLDSQQGLSFTEFTYQLLQAYDFYHLHKYFECSIQVGGSDQWGNIVAGLDLISKLEPDTSHNQESSVAYGITTPLLTTSTGEKFGKSAGNAIWLDPTLTSVFDFYQYFLKVTDADVRKYLKLFTLLSNEEIQTVLETHEKSPELRVAQHRLAAEVTEMVHTKIGVAQAVTRTKLLFGSDYATFKAKDILSAFDQDPRLVKVPRQEILDTSAGKLAAKHGLVSSNSVSRSLISSRGLYLNNQPVEDVQYKILPEELLDGKIAILRAGKDKLLVLAASD
ncbi:unnamed protein product [Cyclocybe aegerita]|uniref:Tyrosine--tRNA ligase n=1 Tax=Cyclocybe aegerita TaxID=1973307 RepID=A0A8S0WNJ0_CYCAE|nr:unnamed protein product [Cyclocybe aegerita]